MQEIPMGVTIFEGDCSNFKRLKVKKEVADYGWVKALPAPLEKDEEVFLDPNQEGVDPRFIRIVHSPLKASSIFHRNHFIWEESIDI